MRTKAKSKAESLMILGMWAVAIVVVFTASTTETETELYGMDFYKELADESDTISIYDTGNLDADILGNRDGAIIIERCIGKVADENGNGYVLELPDEYISYASVENANPGDVVLTYFVYNPDTNYVDDIMYRYDYILEEE